jgi:hypothetical protein
MLEEYYGNVGHVGLSVSNFESWVIEGLTGLICLEVCSDRRSLDVQTETDNSATLKLSLVFTI